MTSTAEITVAPPSPSPAEPGALTVAEWLRAHPWTPEELALGTPLEFLWRFDLDVTAAELWPYVMDTSHFNRAMGMSRMDFREEGGVLHGSTRNAGVLQEWVEVPWTWVAQRTLTCARRYRRGFAHYVRSIYELVPLDGGRRVRFYVYFGWIPRNVFARTFLRFAFGGFEGSYRRVLTEIEAHVRDARATPSPYARPAPELSPEGRARLDALARELRAKLGDRPALQAAAQKLVEHLATADEMDLYRIQILPLARAWGIDRDDLLVACLHATRIGLLNLSWDVICPHCRGVREEARTLGDVPSRGRCDVCRIEFGTDTENSIEITFHSHPSIRDVPKVFFCAAEPASKRHILVQQRVPPGGRARVETALPEGQFRMRLGGEKRYRRLEVSAREGARTLAWATSDEAARVVAAPGAALELVNETGDEATFVVEDVGWSDNALRPVQLFTLQAFRDLFSGEYLTADVQLSIGEQTILFTDMIGSTRFYDTRGDPEAFSEVKRHFTEVYEVVRRNHGAVVKTIGDAVMAAFHQPVDALQAAVEIQAAFPAGRKDSSIRLRISLNHGPCIAVHLNSAIDYFGRTVNVASKLQACVEAGQVSFSRAMRDAPGVPEFLARYGAELEEVVVNSASLQAPLAAYRWDVNGVAPLPRS